MQLKIYAFLILSQDEPLFSILKFSILIPTQNYITNFRSKSTGQMVDNVISNQNSTYLSQQRVEQYFKSLHESNGNQMFYPTMVQKNVGKNGSEKVMQICLSFLSKEDECFLNVQFLSSFFKLISIPLESQQCRIGYHKCRKNIQLQRCPIIVR